MRFVYEYRTSDNVRHTGTIRASSREAAYAALKAKGIRPGSVEDAPGFFNALFGKGKRWIAIAILAFVAIGLVVARVRNPPQPRPDPRAAAPAPRHFVELGDGIDLATVFADSGERFLAYYALPGVRFEVPDAPENLADCLKHTILIDPEDSEAAIELKRIVTGMKDDMRAYLSSDFGNVAAYVLRLEERQAMEAEYRDGVMRRLRAGLVSLEEANAILAAMGLQRAE